jgi:hypothetical protein
MMITKYLGFAKTRLFIALIAMVFGAALILGVRFATYKIPAIHYHANFALYINNQREEFKAKENYSAIEVCTLNNTVLPSERAHMHSNVNDVVHVEDHAVTWGQFFTNLGWTIGPNFIATPTGTIYTNSGETKLHTIINNQDYTDISGVQNIVINDRDKLLLSYGKVDSTTLKKQFDTVPSTANKYDVTKDPASCSGNRTTSIHDRLVHLF